MTVYTVWYQTTFDPTVYLDKTFTSLQETLKYVAGQLEWLDPVEERIWFTATSL